MIEPIVEQLSEPDPVNVNEPSTITTQPKLSDLVLEGKDQNEVWMVSSFMVSMLTTGRPFFKKLITHPLVGSTREGKISKLGVEGVSLTDLVEGSLKLNGLR